MITTFRVEGCAGAAKIAKADNKDAGLAFDHLAVIRLFRRVSVGATSKRP
jgi:hypothetical protein